MQSQPAIPSATANDAVFWEHAYAQQLTEIATRQGKLHIALQQNRGDKLLHHELGQFARFIGEYANAEAHYRQALAADPSFVPSQLALGQMALHRTGFAQGHADYQKRFSADLTGDWRDFPAARWQGEDLRGKRIYLWAEQGLGDIIMFTSLLPQLLAQEPARIVLGVFPKLLTLLERSFPAISVEPLQPRYDPELYKGLFDHFAPLGDLLSLCSLREAPPPFLRADPARVAQARSALSALPGRKIGISWFTTNSQNGAVRNIPLESWRPILNVPNCHFFSLQHGVTADEINAFSTRTGLRVLADPQMEAFRDIENLAALVASMDEVISAQNANVHLGGALGIPTTLMLCKGGDYRWPLAGNANHWYRSVSIERQQNPMDWAPVIARVAEGLRQRTRNHPTTGG